MRGGIACGRLQVCSVQSCLDVVCAHARYLYIFRSVSSRSRNSLSISDSMRFLMTAGFGKKRPDSCLVTSVMMLLWSRIWGVDEMRKVTRQGCPYTCFERVNMLVPGFLSTPLQSNKFPIAVQAP